MHRFKSKVRELGYLTQYKVFFSSSWGLSSAGLYPESSRRFEPLKRVVVISGYGSCCTSTTRRIVKDITKAEGSSVPFAELFSRYISSIPSKQLNINDTKHCMLPCFTRPLSSNYSSQSSQQAKEESRKDISTIEDPFDDAPTYNIPEKPVTFVEGASYSVIILAGLGVAALAAYAVFKELIFEPKEALLGISFEVFMATFAEWSLAYFVVLASRFPVWRLLGSLSYGLWDSCWVTVLVPSVGVLCCLLGLVSWLLGFPFFLLFRDPFSAVAEAFLAGWAAVPGCFVERRLVDFGEFISRNLRVYLACELVFFFVSPYKNLRVFFVLASTYFFYTQVTIPSVSFFSQSSRLKDKIQCEEMYRKHSHNQLDLTLQVKVRIGSPVTGYGQESRNRAARQRISNRVWKDEDGIEHVEVNFYIRGPHGAGKVFAEMFKDNSDKQWRFTYLIVEIMSPTHTQLMLESYVPA
ncbi:hypothetical protein M5K25_007832 [Dendrobium thyrsiflorum]|uniref:Mitochondrial import inner membrane translocase subunit Tim21 n=1 Tax=Dendrobium thyrsiflorum TaxID=117978 RepID=A0ABD0VFD7_DENTH